MEAHGKIDDSRFALVPLQPDVDEQRGRVTALSQASEIFQVIIPEDVRRGEEFLKDIKHVMKGVEERKTTITRPLMTSLAGVRDLFKPLETELADAQKLVKSKILAYSIEQEQIASAKAEAIESKVEAGLMRADTAAGKLEAIEKGKVVGNVRTVKRLHISDESLIPREFMEVNRKAVTEALWAGVTVAGAELKEEKILVTK